MLQNLTQRRESNLIFYQKCIAVLVVYHIPHSAFIKTDEFVSYSSFS